MKKNAALSVIVLLLLASVPLLLRCSSPKDLAGGSSTVDNPKVAGMVLEPNGDPAVDMTV